MTLRQEGSGFDSQLLPRVVFKTYLRLMPHIRKEPLSIREKPLPDLKFEAAGLGNYSAPSNANF